jgi:hypothetical protein
MTVFWKLLYADFLPPQQTGSEAYFFTGMPHRKDESGTV